MIFSRQWAMPTADTFECPPIGDFVRKYLAKSVASIDPFARNSRLAKYTNDINPNTAADSHYEAREWLRIISDWRVDLVLLDPPYSPRQISECYKELSIPCGMEDTQSGKFYKEVRDLVVAVCAPECVVLSFGWNTVGMGMKRGFELIEIMLVCHGGAHNDTICIAERRIQPELFQ